MQSVNRIFVGKKKDFAQLTTAWCWEQWPNVLPPGLLFCVPSALAMRRLRDALILRYKTFQGIRFITPPSLFSFFETPSQWAIASEAEELEAWNSVFQWMDTLDETHVIFKALFPGKPDWFKNAGTCLRVARQLITLRATLVENKLDCETVAQHPATLQLEAREQMRWQALAAMECKYREILSALQLMDGTDQQRAILLSPKRLKGDIETTHLILVGVLDFMPALTDLFTQFPTCDVIIQSTEEQAAAFDTYGRPCPSFWNNPTAPIAAQTASMHAVEKPSNTAEAVDLFLAKHQTFAVSDLCLGIFDKHAIPQLSALMQTHGIVFFEPDPIALTDQPCVQALMALMALINNERLDALQAFMELPDVIQAIPEISYTTLRSAYLEVLENHLPTTVSALTAWVIADSDLARFLQKVQTWCAGIEADAISGARNFLTDLYGTQIADPIETPLFFAAIEAINTVFQMLSLRKIQTVNTVALLKEILSKTRLHPVRKHAQNAYEGRFELLWSKAKFMVLAGLNETIFPDSTFDESFLPNTFRQQLGLRSDQEHLARDAYILDTLCTLFPADAICLIAANQNMRGDVLKPSRLLFKCDDAALIERAERFFNAPPTRKTPSHELPTLTLTSLPDAWPLQQRKDALLTLSASAIKHFIQSPMDFLLLDVFRLKAAEVPTESIDARHFGTCLHATLQCLTGVQATEAIDIAALLVKRLETVLAQQYGSNASIEILASQEALRRRLLKFAAFEAEHRAKGWRTIAVEQDVTIDFPVDSIPFRLKGRIDRLDISEDGQTLLVIDYKTGNNEIKVTRKDEWIDFQLPIYQLLAETFVKTKTHYQPSQIDAVYLRIPSQQDVKFQSIDLKKVPDPLPALKATLCAINVLTDHLLDKPPSHTLLATLLKASLQEHDIG